MKRRSLFAVLAAALMLGGCAGISTVAVDVSSQGDWPAERKPGTYAIERLPSQQASPAEQDRIEAAALPAIEGAGFVRAPIEEADVLIQVGARAFEVASRDPFAHSMHWRHDWWFYRQHHPFFYRPGFGRGFYYNDFPDIQRESAVLMRDRRSQRIVYETRATVVGRWSSPVLLPLLFEASMKDFPTPAISPRTVTVTLPPR
ncbi:MAG: DUF4136 domain-containing protein [Methylibium sp.]|nr:DUF4136 domain-containing protein [Methylibium sp.]